MDGPSKEAHSDFEYSIFALKKILLLIIQGRRGGICPKSPITFPICIHAKKRFHVFNTLVFFNSGFAWICVWGVFRKLIMCPCDSTIWHSFEWISKIMSIDEDIQLSIEHDKCHHFEVHSTYDTEYGLFFWNILCVGFEWNESPRTGMLNKLMRSRAAISYRSKPWRSCPVYRNIP